MINELNVKMQVESGRISALISLFAVVVAVLGSIFGASSCCLKIFSILMIVFLILFFTDVQLYLGLYDDLTIIYKNHYQ